MKEVVSADITSFFRHCEIMRTDALEVIATVSAVGAWYDLKC